MARPRVPQTAGILNLVARAFGFVLSLVLLANVIYETANWGGYKTYWLSYLTVSPTTATASLPVVVTPPVTDLHWNTGRDSTRCGHVGHCRAAGRDAPGPALAPGLPDL
jgi:hypothetical protein